MRYLIRTEAEDALEDLVADEDVRVVKRFEHIPYTSVETTLGYEDLTQRYPDYQISEDNTYDTQQRQRDQEKNR